ncbi:Acetyltransferase (GNAT) family protein [Micromonospora halophytica]|uniref:Acetyltransferase (GNAT) family protein n=1 Tax=Micromonospora halophytica TaxID=47864 RepID=A0A1C5IYH1_9ACTN|nr:Acetyltransferase (GNAT) family protein [Micromonospora halophytica]
MVAVLSPSAPVDLGATLRALRRAADLSQRELAARSGVPQSTIGRLESGQTDDPGFRTVERLVRAVSGRLAIWLPGTEHAAEGTAGPGPGCRHGEAGDPHGEAGRPHGEAGDPHGEGRSAGEDSDRWAGSDGGPETCFLPAVPHEGLRDAADRNCPPHLDAREVREPRDWPGAWWAPWFNLPPAQWPLPLPAITYHRDRERRDQRRRSERVRRECVVRRVEDSRAPTGWRFVAELPDGELVGELRAYERTPHLAYGDDESVWPRELVLDGVLVAPEHRGLGIGRRLVQALLHRMDERGIRLVSGVAEWPGVRLLAGCGFEVTHRTPVMRHVRPSAQRPGRLGQRPGSLGQGAERLGHPPRSPVTRADRVGDGP